MNNSIASIVTRLEGRRNGLVLLAGLTVATAVAIACAHELQGLCNGTPAFAATHLSSDPTAAHVTLPSGAQFSGALSQSKIVQGEHGEVYLSLSLTTPQLPASMVRMPSDTVVVLDHSGSMSSDNRLPYAKRAIHDLIDRMDANDRFALVVFDSSAQTLSPLVALTSDEKARLHAMVDRIQPGSGTNMSSGIQLATNILSAKNSDRVHKVIMLSDGEANEGITDLHQLDSMVSAINKESAAVSTIGMGLGFNEQLMASLADWGGGSFSYLEHLDTLGDILNKNLQDARQTVAANSSVDLTLPDGVQIVDAGGYPIERTGSIVHIPTGQLLSGSDKRLTVTLSVPTSGIGAINIGPVAFQYGNGDATQRLELSQGTLQLAVVEPSLRSQAVASINQAIYKDSWTENNLGVLKRRVHEFVSRGDLPGAQGAVSAYESDLKSAEKTAAAPIASPGLQAKLGEMKKELTDAGQGSAYEQQDKQNRLGKQYFADGLATQRK